MGPPTAKGKPDYSKRLNPPIFLKRNIKVMRKIRDSKQAREGDVRSNGLVQRIVPHLNQIAFDKEGEDVYVKTRKSKLKANES